MSNITNDLDSHAVFEHLTRILEARKQQAADEKSYVASLHKKGLNKILEKVGEETTETILAAKDAQISSNNNEIISETADLIFHTMVMLSHLGTDIHAVTDELAKRFDISGLDEKASRTHS